MIYKENRNTLASEKIKYREMFNIFNRHTNLIATKMLFSIHKMDTLLELVWGK